MKLGRVRTIVNVLCHELISNKESAFSKKEQLPDMVRARTGQVVPAAVSSWTVSEWSGARFDDGVKK